MNLTFRRIREPGELNGERIVLRAAKEIDLGDYAIFRAPASGNDVYSTITHAFWFPDQKLRANDLVILYTKSGKQGRKENKDGSSSHFFYWGLDDILWHTNDFAPVIVEIARWQPFILEAQED